MPVTSEMELRAPRRRIRAAFLWVGLFLAIVMVQPAAADRVVSAEDFLRTGNWFARHPESWQGTLVVPRDLKKGGHLRFDYWRTLEKRPGRGSIVIDIEVHRDTDDDGKTDIVEKHSVRGRVKQHALLADVGPLPRLQAGDLVLWRARFRRMPRLGPFQRVTLETTLSESDSFLACSPPENGEGEITPPRKLFWPIPRYTVAARIAGITGDVLLEAILDCTGRVTRLRILKRLSHGLDLAGVDALSQWRFEPARIGGQPVAARYNLTINFELQAAGPSGVSLPDGLVTARGRFEPLR